MKRFAISFLFVSFSILLVSSCSWLMEPQERERVPAVLPAEQARVSVAECMGKGVPVFSTETADHLAAREMSGIVPVYPSAEALGAVWLSLAEARREELLESPAEPLYVRAPHITRAKRPAWAVKA